MAKKKHSKIDALTIGNPQLAQAMREKARSGAAGVHDTRPKGTRDRGNARRNAIRDSVREN